MLTLILFSHISWQKSIAIVIIIVSIIACVARISVWFRGKEIPRKETFGFDRARNETRAKK